LRIDIVEEEKEKSETHEHIIQFREGEADDGGDGDSGTLSFCD
jgi:hypothetical protein